MSASPLRHAWERITLYLPVLLMGLLALGSWWLVRNAPQPLRPAEPLAATREPDYFMRDFAVRSFDGAGRLQSTLRGRLAQHYPDSDLLEIDAVQIRAVSPDQRITRASADRAISNGDGTELQLIGHAVVERTARPHPGQAAAPPLRFEGEHLYAWVDTERVRSDRTVTLTQGGSRLSAERLDYDHKAQILQMQGRVRGVMQPREK